MNHQCKKCLKIITFICTKRKILMIGLITFLMVSLTVIINYYKRSNTICWGSKNNCESYNKTDEYIHISISTKNSQVVEKYFNADPKNRTLVFLEGYKNSIINPRRWCSVESAAKVHPKNNIIFFVTSRNILKTFVAKEVLEHYKNIKVIYIDEVDLFKGSVLESWYQKRLWEISYWPKSHYNDALRWLLLWKYGGIYLDTDVIVKEDLVKLGNFMGYESNKYFGAGAISVERHNLLVQESLHIFARDFDGKVWGAYGPELLTEVLIKKCGITIPKYETPLCSNYTLFPPEIFYPIPWWNWKLYLEKAETLTNPEIKLSKTKGFHVWNNFLRSAPIKKSSDNVFNKLTQELCPVSFLSSDEMY